jgi:hypothetical protein
MRSRKTFALLGILAVSATTLVVTSSAAYAAPYRRIRPVGAHNETLEVEDGDKADGARVQLWDDHAQPWQEWTLVFRYTNSTGTRIYWIRNNHSGKCLAYRGGIGYGAEATQYTCNTSRTNQLWWFKGPSDYTNIKTLNKDSHGRHLCLEVQDSYPRNGGTVQLWACEDQDGSYWNLQRYIP